MPDQPTDGCSRGAGVCVGYPQRVAFGIVASGDGQLLAPALQSLGRAPLRRWPPVADGSSVLPSAAPWCFLLRSSEARCQLP